MSSNRYVSFIGYNRNDNYTPNNKVIYNAALNLLLQQLKDYKIPSEIIIVEWNYLEDEVPFSDTLKITVETDYTKIRIIRVPPSYHKKFKNWKQRPFHPGAALNVGIKRAKGEFLLPMACDTFFTNAIFEFISKQTLRDNRFYRCDRHDVASIVLANIVGDKNKFFEGCRKHTKIHHTYLNMPPMFRIPSLHTNACGDFCLASRKLYEEVRGYKEGGDTGALDTDSLVVHSLYGMGIKQVLLPENCKVYKIFHEKSTARSLKVTWSKWQTLLDKVLMRFDPQMALSSRMLLNYPKRHFSYAVDAKFDSFERNFIKPARRWAMGKAPFYLNDNQWGLADIEFEENIVL